MDWAVAGVGAGDVVLEFLGLTSGGLSGLGDLPGLGDALVQDNVVAFAVVAVADEAFFHVGAHGVKVRHQDAVVLLPQMEIMFFRINKANLYFFYLIIPQKKP